VCQAQQQRQPATSEASKSSPLKKPRRDEPRSWVHVGATDKEEAVMAAVFKYMSKTHGRTYADMAATRRLLDEAVAVFKSGHVRNVSDTHWHEGVSQEWDKIIFIFNGKKGVLVAQPWHVDASTNICSSFCMWTAGLPTNMMETVIDYPLEAAFSFMGIPPQHHAAAKAFAKTQRVVDISQCFEEILCDLAPAMSKDFDLLRGCAASVEVQEGWMGTSCGPVPHCGPGSGKFRLCMLLTSFPENLRGSRGYNTEVQHHRSQVSLYFWCFETAVHWLHTDRKESPDAAVHWREDHARTAVVIQRFLNKAADTELSAAVREQWARLLAHAYMADHDAGTEWKAWVPVVLREEPSVADKALMSS
jgi:hypothetical protein